MVSERNRIIELSNYIRSFGIDVNIGKTKARGNKGFFSQKYGNLRIDISKDTEQDRIITVMLHEFAHYIHYSYDKDLKSLDFVFGNFSDELKEELINITVHSIPKTFAQELYSKKSELASSVKSLSRILKQIYSDFQSGVRYGKIENRISLPYKYLTSYDRVQYQNKIYSVEDIENYNISEVQKFYIRLKTAQRHIKRINSRINKLNGYYNNPTELFARFVEIYYTEPEKAKKLAPKAYNIMSHSKLPELEKIKIIINN